MSLTASPEKTITLPVLHPGQAQVLAEAKQYNVVCCGRRWGKSLLGVDLITNCALEGYPVAWFAPTYKDLAEIWHELKETLRPVTVTHNESLHQLRLMGGGVVDCWSLADEDSGRGRKYKLAVIDEAAMVPHLEKAWNATIVPTLTDYEGTAWLLSTPKGLNYFYHLWMRRENSDKWASWQMPTTTNPHISAAFVAEQGDPNDGLPQAIFQQEYLAAFIADGAGVFRRVTECATADARTPYPGTFVMGVDWGRVNDFTVLIVMDAKSGAVVAMERFNQIDWHVQRSRLEALYHTWRVTAVLAEENSIGSVNIDALRQSGISVQPFVTTETTKRAIIEKLAHGMEHGDVTFPAAGPYQALVNELMAFQTERMPSGKIRYTAPHGQHDDCVIALALAYRAADRASGSAEEALKSLPVYEVN